MEAVVLNEGFKALVREAFPDRSEKVITIFDEVIRSKASNESLGVQELKTRAIEEIRGELATKDFVRAEIAEVRAEIAEVRTEIASVKSEIIRWVIGLQVSSLALIVAAVKFL